jgi:predicted RNA-binding Zn-ribbon protein involved in translation (DUF1610 family)
MTTVIHESTHRARKRHQCGACLAPIHPGDLYVRQRCVDVGDAWVWRAHVECDAEMQRHEPLDDVYPEGFLVNGHVEPSAEWAAWYAERRGWHHDA